MTLDTTNMAARPDIVKFDRVTNCGGDETPCFWGDTSADGGVRTGALNGVYMTAGRVTIADAPEGISQPETVAEGSTDQALRFSFKLTKPIPPGTILHFVVQKVQTGPPGTAIRTIDSLPLDYPVRYQPEAPQVTGVTQEDKTLTVAGNRFRNTPPDYPLIVVLNSPTGGTLEVKPTSIEEKKLVLNVPDDAAPPGCWNVTAQLANALGTAQNNSFTVPPSVEKATLAGGKLTVEGAGLDAKGCNRNPPTFTLVHGGNSFTLTPDAGSTATKATFTLTGGAASADATWTLQVEFDGKDVKTPPLTAQ
jgi:hypothetical protein